MLPSNESLINNPETFSHSLPKYYLNILLNSRQIISNIYEIVKLKLNSIFLDVKGCAFYI
jgi:hypothetical protein